MVRRTVAIALLSALLALAQQKSGGSYGNWLPGTKKDGKVDPTVRAVQGSVKNEDDSPAVGAIVQLKNLKSLQIRSFITKSDGIFTFTGLSRTVDYEIHAELKGMQSSTRTISTFDDRARVIMNLRLDTKK